MLKRLSGYLVMGSKKKKKFIRISWNNKYLKSKSLDHLKNKQTKKQTEKVLLGG